MKYMLFFCVLLLCLVFISCVAQRSDPKRYAELRIGTSDKVQVLICGDYWMGLIGPDGFGGYRQDIYYWATLQGNGPDYTNIVFHEKFLNYSLLYFYSNHHKANNLKISRLRNISLMKKPEEKGENKVQVKNVSV